MKKLIVTIVINLLVFNYTHAQSKVSYSESRTESDKKPNEYQIVYSDDKTSIEIKQSGEFKMSEDEQSIIAFSKGAYISYRKDGKRLKIEKNEQNVIVYQFNGGEKKSKLSNEEQKILSDVLKDLIAHGFGVKERAERLYNKGGLKAILNEVELVKGDYAKAKYFEVLFEKDNLSKTEIIQVYNHLSSTVSSDYEKARLLRKCPPEKLKDADISNVYYATLKSINSDYEKSAVIKSILVQALTQEQFSTAFQFIENIESDYEKSEIIKSVIKNKPMSNEIFYTVLKASSYIGSDYEVSGIYKKMIKKLIMTETQWLDCFTSIQKIGSDYEKGGVLEDAFSRMPGSEKVKKAFSDCAKTISSDYEYGKLMKSIQ